MPGALFSNFENPLRTRVGQAPSLRVIDVFLDIIALDMIRARLPPPGVTQSDVAAIPPPFLAPPPDAEAVTARNLSNQDFMPPSLNGLTDVTWAFLQATGARPEPWEVEEAIAAGQGGIFDPALGTWRPIEGEEQATAILDPITAQPVFPINPNLPSLNRRPGIIFVPVGLFPICGTIILFNGQQIVGVADTPEGSVLVKYGDGACIRTQNATNLADDRHMTWSRALNTRLDRSRERPRLDALFLRFQEKFNNTENLDARPSNWLRRPGDNDEQALARRREAMGKQLIAGEFPGSPTVRLSRLYVEQRDWYPPAGAPAGAMPWVAQAWVDDELSDPLIPAGFTQNTDFRDQAVNHSSVGLDLIGANLSIIEQVTVANFWRGVGARFRPRVFVRGAQAGYLNQVRHCRALNCQLGFLLQPVLGPAFESRNEDQGVPPHTAERLSAGSTGNNSTVFFHCQVRYDVAQRPAGAPWPRAGMELRGPTLSAIFCDIQQPEPPAEPEVEGVDPRALERNACIINMSPSSTLYRNRLQGGSHHILFPPSQQFLPPDPARDPAPDSFHLKRPSTAGEGRAAFSFYNLFFSFANTAPPGVRFVEFATRAPRLNRADLARTQLDPAQPDARPAPPRFVDAWDHGQIAFGPIMDLDIASGQQSGQTPWTSTNLLHNVRFMPGEEEDVAVPERWRQVPRGWRWQFTDAPEPTSMARLGGWMIKEAGERRFADRVVQVSLPGFPLADQPQGVSAPFRFTQTLIPSWSDHAPEAEKQAFWARYARIHGQRIVAGCWVRASHPDVVRIGFDSPSVEGRGIWRAGEWLFLTTFTLAPELQYPDTVIQGHTIGARAGLDFFIEIVPPQSLASWNERYGGQPITILFGGPQVSLGPEIFPLGPGPLHDEACGALKFARGFEQTRKLSVAFGQRQSSALIGIPARLEKIFVDAESAKETKRSRFTVELLGEKHRRPLCEFTVSPDGESEMSQPLAEEVPLSPGDLVVTRLVSGPERGVDVYLQLVHSQVV